MDKLQALEAAYAAITEAKRLLSQGGTSSLWASCAELQDDIYAEMSAERKNLRQTLTGEQP